VLTCTFYVYIVVDPYGAYRVGVTNDLALRLSEYRRVEASNGTIRREPTRLLYYEVIGNLSAAMDRERVLKAWKRGRKKRLIRAVNPEWRDLLDRA
jgi:putative endonuclease